MFLPVRLKRYDRKPAWRATGNRVRDDGYVTPVPPTELSRVFPGNVFWPSPVPPEVCQRVEQKNDAQAIQNQENCHGHWTLFLRKGSDSLSWHPFCMWPVDE
jgi:hypothetical protein